MLFLWTKNSLYSINIQDTVTNMVPFCSVYQAPSYESNLTFLAPFPTELAYLSMLFILEVVCTGPVKYCRLQIAVSVSILMEWGQFFVHHGNLWWIIIQLITYHIQVWTMCFSSNVIFNAKYCCVQMIGTLSYRYCPPNMSALFRLFLNRSFIVKVMMPAYETSCNSQSLIYIRSGNQTLCGMICVLYE